MLTLHRTYHKGRTEGQLRLAAPPMLFTCATMERPWRDNARNVSCIPEGTYELRLRESPVVQRTSGGEYTEGWELVDVPDRTYIMLHPGNWVDDVEGCIAVGRHHGTIADRPAVVQSRDTFRELMELLAQRNDWVITITGDKA